MKCKASGCRATDAPASGPLPAAHLADHQVAPALGIIHRRVNADTEKVLVHRGLQERKFGSQALSVGALAASRQSGAGCAIS